MDKRNSLPLYDALILTMKLVKNTEMVKDHVKNLMDVLNGQLDEPMDDHVQYRQKT